MIPQTPRCIIHVIQPSKAVLCGKMFIEAFHSSRGSIQIFLITGGPESIKVGFENFRTEYISSTRNVKSVLFVEIELSLCW